MAAVFSRHCYHNRPSCVLVLVLTVSIAILAIRFHWGQSTKEDSTVNPRLAEAAAMAWMSSGSSNAALVANLANHKLINSDRVRNAMLSVRQ